MTAQRTATQGTVHGRLPKHAIGFANTAMLGIYWLCVGAFVAYIWAGGQARSAAPAWLAYWCLVSAGLAVVPKFPLAGPCLYMMLAYGMSSNARELDLMLSMRILDGTALLLLAGWLVAERRRTVRWVGGRGVILCGILLFAWIAISLATALLHGTPYGTFPRHDPSGFIQAAVLLLVTRSVIQSRRDCTILGTVICATIVGRVAIQGSHGIYLESYIATLLIVGAPLALLGMRAAQGRPARAILGVGAVAMIGLLALTQNRAAAVAAVATIAAFLWQSRHANFHKWLAGTVIVASFSVMLAPSGYFDRFRALLDPALDHATAGLDRNTARERLELWSAGWGMAMQQPLVGVGPGNYPLMLGIYLPGRERLAAHSNYVQMLAETGIPGLSLYLAFFVGTLVMLNRMRAARRRGPWQRSAAQMLQLSLIAYLSGGIFNSRHDFVLAYVLVGWALALRDIESEATDGNEAGANLASATS